MMKVCSTCGNDIPQTAGQCRFCGAFQAAPAVRSPARGRNAVTTVNIKAGLPAVDEGIARLEDEIMRAKHSGVRLVRVIHGWGSGGSEGKLKKACRALLKQKKETGRVKSFLPGEEYSRDNPAARNLANRYPELLDSERTDRHNPGITFVELGSGLS